MPTYRFILKKSLEITLKNKKLWFVGFWAALLGNGGEYEIIVNNFKNLSTWSITPQKILSFFTSNTVTANLLLSIKNLIAFKNPGVSFIILIVLCAVVYLSITAQGTLIAGAYLKITKSHRLNIKKIWIETRSKFWELLMTNIIFRGAGILLALFVSAPFIIFLTTFTRMNLISSSVLVGLVVFTPIIIAFSFLVKYTLIYIIIKNKDPLSSFAESWKLFSNHTLVTIENALMLLGVNLILAAFTLIAMLLISFPLITTLSVVMYPLALPEGFYLAITAWVGIVLAPIVGSIYATFQFTTWTYLFTKLHAKRKIQSKVSRFSNKFLKV